MKSKLLNMALVLASFMGYLEWGTDRKMLLIQGEAEIIARLFSDPGSVLHPFILLPLLGQLLLLATFFQRRPGKVLTYSGLACLSILLLFMFFIGLLGLNYKILISTIPFLVIAFFVIRDQRQQNRQY